MQTEKIHILVRRAQTGDKAAKNKLLEMFRPLIRKAAGQAHLAPIREDAEQEAALAFLRAVADFDEKRGVPFEGFAKAMVYGGVRTFFVRERRYWEREVLPVDFTDEDGKTEDFFAGIADERADFLTSLAALPAREQKILSLYYEKDFSLRTVGASMGMKEKHISVVKARAMKKLRRELGAVRTRRKRTKKRRPRRGRR